MTGSDGSTGDWKGNRAFTAPDHPDVRMRGRRYVIPPRPVFRAARLLADGGLPGWKVVAADASTGRIRAEARTRILRFTDDVEIRVEGAPGARSTVHLTSASRLAGWDFGTNARRIRTFLECLDRRLGVAGE